MMASSSTGMTPSKAGSGKPGGIEDPWAMVEAPPVREQPRVALVALGLSESDGEIVNYFADVVSSQVLSSAAAASLLNPFGDSAIADTASSVGDFYSTAGPGVGADHGNRNVELTIRLDFSPVALLQNAFNPANQGKSGTKREKSQTSLGF